MGSASSPTPGTPHSILSYEPCSPWGARSQSPERASFALHRPAWLGGRMRFVCVFVAMLSFMVTGATATALGATVAFAVGDTLVVTAQEPNELQFRLTNDLMQDDLIS